MAAPTFQAVNTYQGGGAVQLTVPWPAHAVDDIAFLIVNSVANVGLLTASGFVEVADSPQLGTQCGCQVYWCRATSTSMASPVTNTGSNNISAQILTVRGAIATGDPWDVTVGGNGGVATTTLTTSSDTSTVDDCLIVYCIGRSSDFAGAQFSGEADANVTNLAERIDDGTATGNGGGIAAYTANRVTAGAFGPLTATLANTSIKSWVLLAIKPVGAAATVAPPRPTIVNFATTRASTY